MGRCAPLPAWRRCACCGAAAAPRLSPPLPPHGRSRVAPACTALRLLRFTLNRPPSRPLFATARGGEGRLAGPVRARAQDQDHLERDAGAALLGALAHRAGLVQQGGGRGQVREGEKERERERERRPARALLQRRPTLRDLNEDLLARRYSGPGRPQSTQRNMVQGGEGACVRRGRAWAAGIRRLGVPLRGRYAAREMRTVPRARRARNTPRARPPAPSSSYRRWRGRPGGATARTEAPAPAPDARAARAAPLT